jgi:hypothetical protein
MMLGMNVADQDSIVLMFKMPALYPQGACPPRARFFRRDLGAIGASQGIEGQNHRDCEIKTVIKIPVSQYSCGSQGLCI